MILAVAMLTLITISSVNVYYGYTNVTVIVNYELNDFQKLGVFLFGADQIEDDIIKLVNGTFEIEKVDVNHAILRFNVTDCGNYVYFQGVKINREVDMRLVFPSNVTVYLNTTDEIPAVYMFK